MAVEKVETLIIGGGQAGLAVSRHLGKLGKQHLLVERRRIAERWRAERWDSLVANGPAWHDAYPGLEFPGFGPDEFVPKEKIADAFEAFEEVGDPFDPDLAAKLEKFILSAGGSDEAETLYTAFRGQMPGVEALLKGRGLLEAS